MQAVLRREAVEDQPCGREEGGGQEHGEPHFGFADGVVAPG